MSEEELKAADADAAKEEEEVVEEEAVEEISEEDLEGVTGGIGLNSDQVNPKTQPKALCTCGEDNCDCMSCDTESTAD